MTTQAVSQNTYATPVNTALVALSAINIKSGVGLWRFRRDSLTLLPLH
jgi:hypothetical protein